jgi:hypothetical protein
MDAGRTFRLVIVAALVAMVLPAAAAAGRRVPPLVPSPRDALTLELANGSLTEAQYALERARSLFQLSAVRARHGMVAQAGPRAATLILRDLVARLGDLPSAGQAEAHRILARPTDPAGSFAAHYSVPEATPYCTTNTCVHYVATTGDAPPPGDTNGNFIPDYIESVGAELEHIWEVEVTTYGFRPPLPDLTSTSHGPDGRIDVYIADVGGSRLYGYCTTDDPNAGPSYPFGDVSAFCVLDNDYGPSQFPSGAVGLQALQVTAAHEFFHAVQAAYDFFDDAVLMEGTAVWMEDQVYDDVNDNYQYLAASALVRPDVPLDLALNDFSNDLAGFQYGAFVFFRFLSETFEGPEIIREIWERADASPTGADEYSIQAVDIALGGHGATLRGTFAAFGAANAFPAASYEEGADYPTPPVSPRITVTASRRTASGQAELDHLTNFYASFRPGAGVGSNAKLRLALDLPSTSRGSEATLVVVSKGGALTVIRLKLSSAGDATRTVNFGKGKVASIVLVLTNASARYQCWHFTVFACQGVPLDDERVFRYRTSLVQPK